MFEKSENISQHLPTFKKLKEIQKKYIHWCTPPVRSMGKRSLWIDLHNGYKKFFFGVCLPFCYFLSFWYFKTAKRQSGYIFINYHLVILKSWISWDKWHLNSWSNENPWASGIAWWPATPSMHWNLYFQYMLWKKESHPYLFTFNHVQSLQNLMYVNLFTCMINLGFLMFVRNTFWLTFPDL